MRNISTLALVAGIATFVGASGASAQQFKAAGAVERSGRTFHAKVCPTFEGPGTARCFAHVVTDAAGNILISHLTPNATPSGYGSATLQAAYGISPAKGAPGTGKTVAIVDAYGYPNAASDLNVYRTQFGLGSCTTSSGCLTIINQTGGSNPPRTNTGWDQEQALDLDMVSTMCPNCKILLVQASSSSYSNLATAVNTAYAKGALVISNSYGGSEGSGLPESAYNHAGVAITASAGDSGYGAQFPATSPHVIAVGGTSLTPASNSRGFSETVWSGTGSGCSAIFGQPSCSNRRTPT